jgi:DNA-binding beta-propeller fold protein YncE
VSNYAQRTPALEQGCGHRNRPIENIMIAKVCLRTLAAILVLGWLPLLATGPEQGSHAKSPSQENLPTGMSITPTAAKGSTFQPLNPDLPDLPHFTADHPITTAISPDGNTLLVLTSGYNHNFDVKGKAIPAQSNEYVFVYDIAGQQPVKQQALKVPKTYAGLVWAPDGRRFYVSGGSDDNIHVFEQSDGHWTESGEPIKLGHQAGLGISSREEGDKTLPNHAVVAGLAVNPNGSRLLAANYANDSVSLIDPDARKVVAELDLRPGKNDPAQKGVPGGEYPYGVVFKGDDKAYVSSLRDREIVVIDLHATPKITGRIKVRGQPGKLILNKAQSLVLAAADNSDSVVMVDTRTDRVVAEIKTTAPASIFPNHGNFKGSMPNSLALSPDEKTLYVTNGGTNSIAVISLARDLDDSHVSGLIPTGWYPTSVSVGHSGSVLYAVNGKSNAGPNPGACKNSMATSGDKPCALAQQYVWQLEKGGLSVIPRPSGTDLAALTLQVARNNHFLAPVAKDQPGPTFSFLRNKIKHVIYIVKENRTYDQVLGDLEKGNGDPALALFPGPLAPNHHELARRFVTLDNFYDSGEVSGNGWNWSTAARVTDLTERTIPVNYAQRGLTYDVEGVNRGINVGARTEQDRLHGKLDDPEDQLPGTADVAAPDGPGDETGAGYLWDSALRAGLSVRNYGFFANLAHYSATPEGGPPVPLLRAPAQTGVQVAFPANPRLQDITDLYFRSFDMRFADYWRFKEWEREFDDYVQHDSLPNLQLLRLPHDHFGNFSEAQDGVNTVETQMADNDYSLGMVVDKVAHSRYAHNTLIFVVEDDAQNGPDHVDANRSIAFVVGPYVKQGALVSRRFNTVSMLRTIEEVLGIKPLGLFDAVQPPMTEVFSTRQSTWTYSARVPDILRTTKLPLPVVVPGEKPAKSASSRSGRDATYWTEKTRGFDFSVEDRLDSAAFNLVLWNGLKGEDQAYPAQRDGRDLRKNRRQLLEQFKKNQGKQ